MAPPAPVAAAAAAAADGQVQGGRQQGGIGQSIGGIIRMAVIWYFASKFFSSSKKPSDPSQLSSNIFPKGEPLDMWFYITEHEKFNDFGSESALVWHETNIPYATYGPESTRTLSMKYYPSEALKHNGSLYAHVFFARSGYPADPNDPEYLPLAAFGKTHVIVTHLPKSKAGKKRSLLGASKDTEEDVKIAEVVDDTQGDSEDNGPEEWVSYFKPNVTVNLVDDFTRYPHNAVPPNVAPCILLIILVWSSKQSAGWLQY